MLKKYDGRTDGWTERLVYWVALFATKKKHSITELHQTKPKSTKPNSTNPNQTKFNETKTNQTQSNKIRLNLTKLCWTKLIKTNWTNSITAYITDFWATALANNPYLSVLFVIPSQEARLAMNLETLCRSTKEQTIKIESHKKNWIATKKIK